MCSYIYSCCFIVYFVDIVVFYINIYFLKNIMIVVNNMFCKYDKRRVIKKKKKDKGKINDMVWNLGMYSFIFK